MRDNDFLSLQANIICLLLALIGSAAIVKHPDWFGGPIAESAQVDSTDAQAMTSP
jgi:hypothetical protein